MRSEGRDRSEFDEASSEWLAENNRRINEESVVLRFSNRPKLLSTLLGHIDPSGNLVISGHDLGPQVASIFADDEYEYWLKIRPEHLPALDADLRHLLTELGSLAPADASLLELLQSCFQQAIFASDVGFRSWLQTKSIPSEFFSWI